MITNELNSEEKIKEEKKLFLKIIILSLVQLVIFIILNNTIFYTEEYSSTLKELNELGLKLSENKSSILYVFLLIFGFIANSFLYEKKLLKTKLNYFILFLVSLITISALSSQYKKVKIEERAEFISKTETQVNNSIYNELKNELVELKKR